MSGFLNLGSGLFPAPLDQFGFYMGTGLFPNNLGSGGVFFLCSGYWFAPLSLTYRLYNLRGCLDVNNQLSFLRQRSIHPHFQNVNIFTRIITHG